MNHNNCEKKVKRYKKEAVTAANKIKKEKGIILVAYQCKWCNFWHIGKKKNKKVFI